MTVTPFPDRKSYIDRDTIEAACEVLENEVRKITVGSVNRSGAVDILAYEIAAYISAIRRAVPQ